MRKVKKRVKGETVIPTATLALVQKIGVTRASKEIGVSTTTLHKARKSNEVSRSVEIASRYALEHLSDAPGESRVQAAPVASTAIVAPGGDTALIVMEVPTANVTTIEKLAERLGAKLIAA